MTTRRRAGARGHPEVYEQIVKLAYDVEKTWSGAQIHTKLEAELPKKLKGHLPDVRTIQRIVRELRPDDTSGIWSLAKEDAPDAYHILEVMQVLMGMSRGAKVNITNDDAQWILKIRRIAPDLDAGPVWTLVQLAKARPEGADMADIHTYLAFKPWKGQGYLLQYEYILGAGHIPRVPIMHVFVPNPNNFTGGDHEGDTEEAR
jgi:hypothetical protein